MRTYRSTRPYWLNAKFASKCTCGKQIRKGDRIYYYPATHSAVCQDCGDKAAHELAAADFDEQVYNYGM